MLPLLTTLGLCRLDLDETEHRLYILLDTVAKLGIGFEHILDVLSALTQPFALVREPSTAFLYDVVV